MTSAVAPQDTPKPKKPAAAIELIACLVLCSCAVGTDFQPPGPPRAERFTAEKDLSLGNGQRFDVNAETPQYWWTAFRSRKLDDLIEEAIEHNPSLQIADAAIRAAEFNTQAATGAFLPQVALGSNTSYNFPSGDSTSSTVTQTAFSYFTKQVQISYAPDIWGANARAVESLDAQRESLIYQKQATQTLLAANVAKAAIEEASLRGQIAATRRIVGLEQERLNLLNLQFSHGAVAGTDLLSQQSALAQARELLPALESQLARQRNLLTALAGRYSSQEIEATFELSQIATPRDLPVSLPSRLVSQRPDIKAAEANIHAASARVGVAVAARLPSVVLTANGGSGAFQLAQLFTPGTWSYAVFGNVAQPVFDGMTLLNRQHAAEAGLDQAQAQYRDTVLKAFQEVADTLRALQSDAKAVASARSAESTSKGYLDKIRLQQRKGAVSQLVAVDAQHAYFVAANARIQAEARRLADTVALFVALGGGWSQNEKENAGR